LKKNICSNCQYPTVNFIEPWLEKCPNCQLWRAHLQGRFNESQEDLCHLRNFGFRDLRITNFKKILAILGEYTLTENRTIVDIGCANGWFVDEAQKLRMQSSGIEPEPAIAKIGINQGLPIRIGFFPDILKEGELFDNMIFNDVFEHLPDPEKIFKECYLRLSKNGFLILNIPNSRGFFFRLSLFLARIGFKSPLYRLWQVDFYTPHLFYFNPDNLMKMAKKFGFEYIAKSRLFTIKLSGLWERLNIPGAPIPIFKRIAIYLCVAIASPVINYLLPSDSFVLFLRKI
jgi:2-polyprenyl-3-methyl-5-hydroxy-6-metoxy-1,4-benzoquinol methylase